MRWITIARRYLLWGLVFAVAFAIYVGPPLYRYWFLPETEVYMQLSGEACGAHLRWQPDQLVIQPGQRVRFVNDTRLWTAQVRLAATEGPHTAARLESPPLSPGASWQHVFWRPGRHFISTVDSTLYWAGLRGWLVVQR